MDENDEQALKFENSLLSFEDSDKKIPIISNSFIIKEDEDSQNNKIKLGDEKSAETYTIYNQKLTIKSQFKLWTTLILIILSLIFIPFYSIAENYLITLEKTKLIDSLENFASYNILTSDSLKNFFRFFNFFLNKDFYAGYLCVLYIVFHPLVAMKIIYGFNFSYCIIILLQILYQNRRPSWEDNLEHGGENEKLNQNIIICEASFSNPSSSLFNFIFCSIYSLYSYRHFFAPPHTHMNIILKFVLLIIFISILITEMILLLIYRLHYLNELIFTICITFVWICLLIGFENKLQNILIRATKNYFKLRKNKIKIFFYTFFELLGGILLYNLIGHPFDSYHIEDKILKSESCSKQQKELLSLSNNFMDLSYIFCLLGAFWGASLPLENNTVEWWYLSQKYFYDDLINKKLNERNKLDPSLIFLTILKGIITIGVFLGIWFIFYYIPYISFLFNFVINCIKYFTLFYVCTGILPIIFSKIKFFNKYVEIKKEFDEILIDYNNSNNLFKSSLFVKCFDKARIPMLTGDNRLPYRKLLSNEELSETEEDKNLKNLTTFSVK